jgi:large subunit ribosomal protein L24
MPATVEKTRIRLRRNDQVEVISGKDAGKRGKVLQIVAEKNRVLVQGVNFIKRHTRPNPQRNIKGGIAEREAPIHVSNLMVVCGECGKRTRIGSSRLEDGRKVRICRKCKGALDR